MTPKEKANQLTDAYYNILPLEKYVTTKDGDLTWEYNSWEEAKRCALIAVDELLRRCWDYRDIDLGSSYDYWQEVKQEIEAL